MNRRFDCYACVGAGTVDGSSIKYLPLSTMVSVVGSLKLELIEYTSSLPSANREVSSTVLHPIGLPSEETSKQPWSRDASISLTFRMRLLGVDVQ